MRVVSYRSASFSPTALSYGTGLLYSLPQLLAEHWASHTYDTSRRNFFGENEIERKLDRMMEELMAPTAIGTPHNEVVTVRPEVVDAAP